MNRLPFRLYVGVALLAVGQALIIVRLPTVSDFYFPVIWYGYILTIDGGLAAAGRSSLWQTNRSALLLMIPVSAGFWWVFEAFNLAVDNWRYLGAGMFTGAWYAFFASVCFSTVVLAIWETAVAIEGVATSRGSLRFELLTRCVSPLGAGAGPVQISRTFGGGSRRGCRLCHPACPFSSIRVPTHLGLVVLAG